MSRRCRSGCCPIICVSFLSVFVFGYCGLLPFHTCERRVAFPPTPFFLFFFSQAGLKLLQDRRLEKALRAVASVGDQLKRLNEIHEELGGQVRGVPTHLKREHVLYYCPTSCLC